MGAVFGVVGREAGSLRFDGPSPVEFLLTREERAAAFMADAYGRVAGRAGACYSTFGPGATNLATGLASALLDRSPVLAISAQVESDSIHRWTHQCVDQSALLRPVTKASREVRRLRDLPGAVAGAVALAQGGIPGPVSLSIPMDLFSQAGRAPAAPRSLPVRPGLDYRMGAGRAASETWRRLARARRPVLLVGGWAARTKGGGLLGRLASRFGIPVAVTYGGKGVVAESHPCFVGAVSKYLDLLAPGALDLLFGPADLVLLAGFDMAEGVTAAVWARGARKEVLAVDSIIEPALPGFGVDALLQAPLGAWAGALLRRRGLRRGIGGEALRLRSEFLSRAGAAAHGRPTGSGRDPYAVMRALNSVLRPDDIVVSDVGLHKQFACLFVDGRRPRRFLCSNGLGSMGFGLPAAIGAKRAAPASRVVAVCGDAGFHASAAELETSVRLGLPVLCLVLRDDSVGLIRHYQRAGGAPADPRITDFCAVDFAALARANGCRGHRLRRGEDLEEVLRALIDCGTSAVVDVPVDRERYLPGGLG